jgi:signal transduction histidine kinase
VVRVKLTGNQGRIELTIHDNGKGFDVPGSYRKAPPGEGLGLTSMRERVELSGGSFSIHSIKRKGTAVSAVWTPQGVPTDHPKGGHTSPSHSP